MHRNTIKKLFVVILICVFASGVAVILCQLDDSSSVTSGSETSHPRNRVPPFPDDRLHNVHWFIQVSDLHISAHYDPGRVPDFHQFCTRNVDVVKPEVVLVSGDITDAKTEDRRGSKQYVWEWKEYDRILQQSGVLQKTVWLDTRGNHDAFNVPSLNHEGNMFRKYSVKGATESTSYRYVHRTGDGTYTFIAVDACPDPGPKRPFNFFGLLDKASMNQLVNFSSEARGSNMTVWFGHYPTSTIGSASPGIRNVMKDGAVYLCGHLHDFAGYVPRMYARHHSGNLELELVDWKYGRRYRIFAIDHDMFSFSDQHFDHWPVVLITNPKDAQFNMPRHEPLGRMLHSTHIRILVFTLGTVETVSVQIDGKHIGEARRAEGPLYVLPWQPKAYATGLHNIQVYVKDSFGHEETISQSFSLEGDASLSFPLTDRVFLLLDHFTNMRVAIVIGILMTLLPLVVVRVAKRLTSQVLVILSGSICTRPLRWFIEKYYLVTLFNRVFYAVLLFDIYVAVGPWFIGYVMDDHIGAVFAWGIVVNGSYIPGSLTCLYALVQYLTCNFPLTLYLGHCIKLATASPRLQEGHWFPDILRYLKNHTIFYLIMVWQLLQAYYGHNKAYGTMAFLLGPLQVWSVIFLVVTRKWALSVTSKDTTHKK